MAGRDAPKHRSGLVVTQRAPENFFHIVRGTQTQIGLAFDGRNKLIQHRVHRFLRQVRDRHHGSAQSLHFLWIEVANDVCGLLLAKQEHEHGGTLGGRHAGQFLGRVDLDQFHFFGFCHAFCSKRFRPA